MDTFNHFGVGATGGRLRAAWLDLGATFVAAFILGVCTILGWAWILGIKVCP